MAGFGNVWLHFVCVMHMFTNESVLARAIDTVGSYVSLMRIIKRTLHIIVVIGNLILKLEDRGHGFYV